ncbi:MAG: hypothetical protein K2P90_01385, partial [Holosporales bacterium]|nr:hypothetical protein [Holosporales bacterium]
WLAFFIQEMWKSMVEPVMSRTKRTEEAWLKEEKEKLGRELTEEEKQKVLEKNWSLLEEVK